jgi:hypothetical protein
MNRAIDAVLAGGLMALGVCLSQGSVQAQFYNPYAVTYQNQLNQQAWAVQQMYAAQATQQAYLAQAAMANQYTPFAGGNPYSPAGLGGNPYSPSLGAGANPYSPYNPYVNPYATSPGIGHGVSLMGSADVMRSYGTVITKQEEARILREKANQAKLDTRKQAFDLEMYIKANTPTYTQNEARVAKETLKRIQNYSLPGEVTNGTALNYLLKDLAKYPGKKIAIQPLDLPDSAWSHINVTQGTKGVGIFRDGGRLTWPTALKNLMDVNNVNKRQELDKQIKTLVEDANRGRLDANALKDVSNEIEKLTKELVSKYNDIPSAQYADAKRFIADFEASVIGLQKGEAKVQADFQRFTDGGKSVQEVVEYMDKNGLRFGPAMAADEGAYRAVHSRLSRYSIEMNTAMGADER